MKKLKVKISENELVKLIEKLVKEGIGGGNGFNFGAFNTPTAKYTDLIEDDDVEKEDELSEDEDNIDTAQDSDKTLNVNVTKQTNQTDWMEEIEESKLISRLKNRLNEEKGKGCAESEGGSGCIKKGSYTDKLGKKYPWHILNNKKGGIWKGCTSKKDCESILDAFHANS